LSLLSQPRADHVVPMQRVDRGVRLVRVVVVLVRVVAVALVVVMMCM
jgi:hypothetical protein